MKTPLFKFRFLICCVCLGLLPLQTNMTSGQDVDFDNLRLGIFGNNGEGEPSLTFMTRTGHPHVMKWQQSPKGLFLFANSNTPTLKIDDAAALEAFSIGTHGVGVGTNTPTHPLHVFAGGDAVSIEPTGFPEAKIVVENDLGDTQMRTMFELINNGASRFSFRNTSTNGEWAFLTNPLDDFVISRGGTGGGEMIMRKDGAFMVGPGPNNNLFLDVDGNMFLMGTLFEVSDRNAKKGFKSVDTNQVLNKVSQLSIQTWQYKDDDVSIRHMGPMAQDFRAAFGLGKDDKTIASVDTTGVAFAAIQALHSQLQEKDRVIIQLEERTQRLEDQLSQIRASLARQE